MTTTATPHLERSAQAAFGLGLTIAIAVTLLLAYALNAPRPPEAIEYGCNPERPAYTLAECAP